MPLLLAFPTALAFHPFFSKSVFVRANSILWLPRQSGDPAAQPGPVQLQRGALAFKPHSMCASGPLWGMPRIDRGPPGTKPVFTCTEMRALLGFLFRRRPAGLTQYRNRLLSGAHGRALGRPPTEQGIAQRSNPRA